jgi:hypothetical protein
MVENKQIFLLSRLLLAGYLLGLVLKLEEGGNIFL